MGTKLHVTVTCEELRQWGCPWNGRHSRDRGCWNGHSWHCPSVCPWLPGGLSLLKIPFLAVLCGSLWFHSPILLGLLLPAALITPSLSAHHPLFMGSSVGFSPLSCTLLPRPFLQDDNASAAKPRCEVEEFLHWVQSCVLNLGMPRLQMYYPRGHLHICTWMLSLFRKSRVQNFVSQP